MNIDKFGEKYREYLYLKYLSFTILKRIRTPTFKEFVESLFFSSKSNIFKRKKSNTEEICIRKHNIDNTYFGTNNANIIGNLYDVLFVLCTDVFYDNFNICNRQDIYVWPTNIFDMDTCNFINNNCDKIIVDDNKITYRIKFTIYKKYKPINIKIMIQHIITNKSYSFIQYIFNNINSCTIDIKWDPNLIYGNYNLFFHLLNLGCMNNMNDITIKNLIGKNATEYFKNSVSHLIVNTTKGLLHKEYIYDTIFPKLTHFSMYNTKNAISKPWRELYKSNFLLDNSLTHVHIDFALCLFNNTKKILKVIRKSKTIKYLNINSIICTDFCKILSKNTSIVDICVSNFIQNTYPEKINSNFKNIFMLGGVWYKLFKKLLEHEWTSFKCELNVTGPDLSDYIKFVTTHQNNDKFMGVFQNVLIYVTGAQYRKARQLTNNAIKKCITLENILLI